MIKYFKRQGLIKITEIGVALLIISVALIMFTGGTLFAMGKHVNLASLNKKEVEAGMYVELEVNEILNVYAQDDNGAYYIIPFPLTEDTKDSGITLMAVYIPKEYVNEANMIMTVTAKEDGTAKSIHLNGKLQKIEGEEKELFKSTTEKTKKDYGIQDAKVMNLCFVPVEPNILDYLVTIFAAGVIIWIIVMYVYILSGKNQEHVHKFIIDNNINQNDFLKEMELGTSYGNVFMSKNYMAFMMLYKVFVVKKASIDSVIQMVRPNISTDGPNAVKEDVLVVRLKNDLEYKIRMKPVNLKKVLDNIEL